MRERFAVIVAAFCVICYATLPVAAEQAFTKDQIVSFFVKSADLGVARGICIGTADECKPNVEPAGFDMLVNFDLNSADLTDEAKENLEIFAGALSDDRLDAARFLVEGHTDATGSENYNATLSERRAASVVSFLLERGIKEEKLVAVGKGESSPRVAEPNSPENRRVEMRINLQ